MPISKRYESILVVLSDPLNRAIVEREVLRRSEKMIPPPVQKAGGGFAYLTIEDHRNHPRSIIDADENLNTHAEVFEAPDGWYVEIALTEDSEVGPFSTLREAFSAAETLLTEQGFLLLRESPWTEEDVKKYPL